MASEPLTAAGRKSAVAVESACADGVADCSGFWHHVALCGVGLPAPPSAFLAQSWPSVGRLGGFATCCRSRSMNPYRSWRKRPAVRTTRPTVARIEWAERELHRARLPLEIYPISAGVKGGLAGGVVMAVLAVIYGISSRHGVWYPINLLAVGFFPALRTTEQIAAFHWDALIIATIVHLLTSLLVGLLYGATLPMFPRRPILLGGFIAPILWSGLLHSFLEVVNPVLNQRIVWPWFVVCQIGFGVVAGIVVSQAGARAHLAVSSFCRACRCRIARNQWTRRTKGDNHETRGHYSILRDLCCLGWCCLQQFQRPAWTTGGSLPTKSRTLRFSTQRTAQDATVLEARAEPRPL